MKTILDEINRFIGDAPGKEDRVLVVIARNI